MRGRKGGWCTGNRRLRGALIALTTGAWLGAGAAFAADDKVTVQWFGQSAFKLTSVSGKVIMIDPFISENPKTPAEFKDLKALGKVDLVLVIHAHGDHVGDGPEIARMNQAPLYGPPGLNDTLVAFGVLPKNCGALQQGRRDHAPGTGHTHHRDPGRAQVGVSLDESRHGRDRGTRRRRASPASSSSLKTASACTTWAIRGYSAT